jgi:hypothetical protein
VARSKRGDSLIDLSEIRALDDWWERIKALIGGADTIAMGQWQQRP